MRSRLSRSLALVGVLAAGALASGAPAVAVPDAVVSAVLPSGPDCLGTDASATDGRKVKGDNTAFESLHVPQAQALVRKSGGTPGAGVSVVVVDS